MEYWGNLSFLKAGVQWCDRRQHGQPHVCARDPHARERHGLRRVAPSAADQLTGIVNGIDLDVWNPATDPHIAVTVLGAKRSTRRRANKAALQGELGLDMRADVAAVLRGQPAHHSRRVSTCCSTRCPRF